MLSLCWAFLLSWTLLVKQNLLYESAYKLLDIEQTISFYGPRNHYKRGFEKTSLDKRVSLFGLILASVDSVPANFNGEHQNDLALQQALRELHYIDNTLDRVQVNKMVFLRQAEIDHLIDVAHLIYNVKVGALTVGGILLFFFTLLFLYKRFNGRSYLLKLNRDNETSQALLLNIRSIYLMMLALMVVSMLLIYFIGAETVFYTLHDWVFPAEHQWFFYYEHSLMSMLMQAPNLFAFVAVVLVFYMLVSQCLILLTSKYLLAVKRR